MTDWDAWDNEDGWDGSPLAPRREPRERLPRRGLNWLAVATLTALLTWVTAMVLAGSYAHAVGYPPISFDHDLDYIAPTDLQNRVRGVWGTLEILSLPVALVAVALSGASFALRRERVTAAVALGISVAAGAVAFVIAIFGLIDFVFRE
ncbi:hypothetical protein [Curtobacterium sp. ISL-83]|uniref:hypothetical protein n=1 Tax=Curtobacterium sp. ISL-83 TaxID=2819145 RepID=UPI001BEA13EC|nr:hypothetical protein [Curtobacterium sp. ISL-83]MBT2501668.1 hypothetical protein [Curtobacterium sp. ISL-83]